MGGLRLSGLRARGQAREDRRVIRGIRQRRRLKHELTAEAAGLRRLVELRRCLAAAQRQTITQLDVLSTEAPSCPRCGATLMVRTAKKKRFNGASFWGCPRYKRCGQGVIPLETYPRAAYTAARRAKKAKS